MVKHRQEVRFILLASIAGLLSCTALGFVFFGTQIFKPDHPLFAMISLGLSGSVLLALLYLKRVRDSVYAMVLLFCLSICVYGFSDSLLVYALYFIMQIVGVWLFINHYYTKIPDSLTGRILLLGAVQSLMFIIATMAQWTLFANGEEQMIIFSNMPIGLLLGLGTGCGFELTFYLSGVKQLSPSTGDFASR